MVRASSQKFSRESLMKKKVRKLVGIMRKEGLDGLYLNRIENVRYSTDLRPVVSMWFQNSYSSVVTAQGDVILLTVAGDYMHFEYYMPWMEDIRVMHGIGRGEEVAKVFQDYHLKRVGFDQLGFDDYQALQRATAGVELVSVGAKVAEERAVKFDEELMIMQESAKVTEASIRGALRSAKAGMREYEIAAEGEYAARKLGAEGMSWGLATFSGLNTGLMLRHDSEKIVRRGELLIMGYATIYRGYNTDITVTTVIGRPSKKQREIYTATYDSYLAGLKATKPGAMTLDIHNAVEKVIVERGFGEYSFSRIQPILHGLGMNVYEPPFSPEPGKKEPSMRLRSGHVLAIEPAITLYDDLKVGGCRIGETLVVTENGYRLMTDGKPETHDSLYEN